MDKKLKKKIDQAQQRIQKLRQQVACAKRQQDDPSEIEALQMQLADAEAELARLREKLGDAPDGHR